MPLTSVSILRGKPANYRNAIAEAVCSALHQAFGVPGDDRFVTITEHDKSDFVYSPASMGVNRSDDLVVIRVVANKGRTLEQKKAFYARLAALLAEKPGIKIEDVLINLTETEKENWSFGGGLAQLA